MHKTPPNYNLNIVIEKYAIEINIKQLKIGYFSASWGSITSKAMCGG